MCKNSNKLTVKHLYNETCYSIFCTYKLTVVFIREGPVNLDVVPYVLQEEIVHGGV